jgi:hypothetical protein
VARPEHARLQVFVQETYGTACRFTTFYSPPRGYAFGLDAEAKIIVGGVGIDPSIVPPR